MKTNIRQKFSILLVLFLGYVGFSIVFPILPSMFLDPSLGYLPFETSLSVRNILLGFSIAMYPLGQFFGCPIFGRLSDAYGRKPVLVITLFCTALLYLVTAVAVHIKFLPLLFLGRFLTGIFEGNITIATAVMADLSEEGGDKTKNFGWLITFSSTGWIVGPLLGGWLADPTLVSWFSYATPFWASSLFLFLCLLLVIFSFNESLDKIHRKKYVHIKEIFTSFVTLLKRAPMRRLYTTNFFFYLPTFIFFIYFGTLMYRWFAATPREIGSLEAYLSIFICFAPLTYAFLGRKFAQSKTLAIAAFGLSISLIILILFPIKNAIWITLIFPSYFIALGLSFSSLLISNAVDKKQQGEALGLNQTCMVLCETLVGLFGGFLIAIWLYLPYVIGAVFCLFSAGLALSYKKVLKAHPKKL